MHPIGLNRGPAEQSSLSGGFQAERGCSGMSRKDVFSLGDLLREESKAVVDPYSLPLCLSARNVKWWRGNCPGGVAASRSFLIARGRTAS